MDKKYTSTKPFLFLLYAVIGIGVISYAIEARVNAVDPAVPKIWRLPFAQSYGVDSFYVHNVLLASTYDSIYLNIRQTYNNNGFLGLSSGDKVYRWGCGLGLKFENKKLMVDTSTMMSKAEAEPIIEAMQDDIALKYDASNPDNFITAADVAANSPVTSVFGRTGAVVSQTGDYSLAQISFSGTSGQYVTGTGALTTFPTIPTNTNQLTNGAAFITAAGVTSSVITTALGYTPVTQARTITINGVTFDLSANRTWTIDGSETKVTAGTGISVSGSGTTGSPYVVSSSASAPSFATPSRALNSNFTISSTRVAHVAYTIRISYSITVLLGSTGVATLQYSTDGGSNWISVDAVSNNLNLGIALTGYNDFVLSGMIPPNALTRINTSATNATVAIRSEQQEVLL